MTIRQLFAASWIVFVLCATAGPVSGQAPAPVRPSAPAPPATAAVDGPGRRLVMPFDNVRRDVRFDWLGEASAVALTDDFTDRGIPAIDRDERLRAMERLRVPAVAALSHATSIRLGQVVSAGQVILGSFEVRDDTLTLRVRRLRLDAGRLLPEVVETGPLSDLFEVYARVARRLVSDARAAASVTQPRPAPAAFEQYIKGIVADAPSTRITLLNQALRLAPTYQRIRLALWAAHTEQSEHQTALSVIRQVPAGDPLARRSTFLASLSLMNLGRYPDAAAALTELNRSSPDPAILNNLGVIEMRRAASLQARRSVTFFTDAAKLDDADPDLFFNAGYAAWMERQGPTAITWLREAVRRNPADDEAHYVLGVALQGAGNAAEGGREKELAKRLSSVFQEWEAKPQGVSGVPRGLERVKMDLDVPAALRVDTAIVAAGQREQRDLAAYHTASGRRLLANERDAEAIAELRRAIYLSPYHSEAHLLLGRTYLREGRVQDAVDELKISVWSEDTIPGRLALAEAYAAAKDPAAARSELQIVLRREPGNADARRALDRLP